MRINELTPATFGFRPTDPASPLLAEAERAFLRSFPEGANLQDLGYERDKVLENEDAYYFPVGWIGCAGWLIIKNPLRAISFGSYVGAVVHLWAYYQGISLAPLREDRRNILRILKVNDRANTLQVLKDFLSAEWVDQKLAFDLAALPLEIGPVDLYFGIGGLLKAREQDWFEFEIAR